ALHGKTPRRTSRAGGSGMERCAGGADAAYQGTVRATCFRQAKWLLQRTL
ncbi:MAG: hypothetical protein AVDCRST_MAG89-3719, partial [uncultured Gemmatimonadetes bacterium]